MEIPKDSGESEQSYLSQLLHNLQQSDEVSEELFTEAYNFVTENIGKLDKLPSEILEIYCGLLVELHRSTNKNSFEDICIKMVSIKDEIYIKKIDYLVDEFPIKKSIKIKQICCLIADLMINYGYEPDENFIIYITQEIFTTQNEEYFEILICLYMKLLKKHYISLQEALKFAESCREDFKSCFLEEIQFFFTKKPTRRQQPEVNSQNNKIKISNNSSNLGKQKQHEKDNCAIM